MPIQSRLSAPIPSCSLQQWIFGSCFDPLPAVPIFVDPEQPDTHSLVLPEYRLLAKRVALGLQRAGLKSGDRVMLAAANGIYYPISFMGILMAGGVFTGASPTPGPRDLLDSDRLVQQYVYQLGDSQASFVLASPVAVDAILVASERVGLARSRIFILDDTLSPTDADGHSSRPPGAADGSIRHWSKLLAPEADAVCFQWIEPLDPAQTICCINYSSGTTGHPKGVEITHGNYVANGVGVVVHARTDPEYSTLSQRAVALCLLPMYHVFSQTFFIAILPHRRIRSYVMTRYDTARMLAHIEAYRVTHLIAVPPILNHLAAVPTSHHFSLGSLEVILSGGSPLIHQTARAVASILPSRCADVCQGFGMTELTCTATAWTPDRRDRDTDPSPPGPASGTDLGPTRPRPVGELIANCRAKLMAIQGGHAEITTPLTPGELWIAGKTIMRGYWRDPVATAAAIVVDADGTRWLRTGDIASVDAYGPGALFTLSGRVRDLIGLHSRAGHVLPTELEAVLLERPDVRDAAVVGVIVDGEEVPRAYVVRAHRPPHPLPAAVHDQDLGPSERDLVDCVAARLAPHKQLRGGVVFVDSIPRSPAGKILRMLLQPNCLELTGERKAVDSRAMTAAGAASILS